MANAYNTFQIKWNLMANAHNTFQIKWNLMAKFFCVLFFNAQSAP